MSGGGCADQGKRASAPVTVLGSVTRSELVGAPRRKNRRMRENAAQRTGNLFILLASVLLLPSCGSDARVQAPSAVVPPSPAPTPVPSPSPSPLPPGSSVTTQLIAPDEDHVFPSEGGFAKVVVAYAVNEEIHGDLWVVSYLSLDGRNVIFEGSQGTRVAQTLSGNVTLQGTATNMPSNFSGKGPLESRFVINYLLESPPGTRAPRRSLAREVVPRHWIWP
jgi:hypothetical protein